MGSRSRSKSVHENIHGAPLAVLQKSKKNYILMAHCLQGAPLLGRTSNGALWHHAPLECMEK